MRPSDIRRAQELDVGLRHFSRDDTALVGVAGNSERAALIRQFVDSLHRVEFVRRLGDRPLSAERTNPHNQLFDPIKAAFLHNQAGDTDEAAWLVFLATHFGYHRRHHWELTRRVYGSLDVGQPWTWNRTSSNVPAFRAWFEANAQHLGGLPFGNHRKYESLRVDVNENLADVVASYIAWVGANRGHDLLFSSAQQSANGDPKWAFDILYRSAEIKRFGRTGKFDYLTMIGKLEITPIEPPHPYLVGATGPVRGARLLITGNVSGPVSIASLTNTVTRLGNFLGLPMQVMEDALCNWQKSPAEYVAFRG